MSAERDNWMDVALAAKSSLEYATQRLNYLRHEICRFADEDYKEYDEAKSESLHFMGAMNYHDVLRTRLNSLSEDLDLEIQSGRECGPVSDHIKSIADYTNAMISRVQEIIA